MALALRRYGFSNDGTGWERCAGVWAFFLYVPCNCWSFHSSLLLVKVLASLLFGKFWEASGVHPVWKAASFCVLALPLSADTSGLHGLQAYSIDLFIILVICSAAGLPSASTSLNRTSVSRLPWFSDVQFCSSASGFAVAAFSVVLFL